MHKTFAALAGAVALSVMTMGASAAPLTPSLAQDAQAGSLVQNVHACHRNVQNGRYGWHYHSGYDCERHAAPPPRRSYSPPREYRRAPVCRRECKYVGPIKICKDRCY